MSFWDNLLGRGAADAGNSYLKQIPGQLHSIYDPYAQQGKDAYNQLNPQYTQMNQDPTGYLDKIMQQYRPSAGYQLKEQEGLQAAGNSAAAGGMRGSLQDIKNSSRLADSLMGEDMQQWLQNVMGIQGAGMQGQQHFYDTGYNAASNLGGDLSNVLGTQGQLAFQGQSQQNRGIQDLVSGLLGAGAMGAGAYFGGAKFK